MSYSTLYNAMAGEAQQLKIIKVFGSLWLPLAFISIAISTYSIYVDLELSLGFALSLTIALFFATVLVAFSHYALNGMFGDFKDRKSNILMAIVFIILAVLSVIIHFKSLDNLEVKMNSDTELRISNTILSSIKTKDDTLAKMLETNKEFGKVYNNKDISDDILISKNIESSNKNIATYLQNDNTYSMLLDSLNQVRVQDKTLARSTTDTLLFLFIILEFMSYFTLLSKVLISWNVTEEEKAYISLQERIATFERSYYRQQAEKLLETTQPKQPTQPTQPKQATPYPTLQYSVFHGEEAKDISLYPKYKITDNNSNYIENFFYKGIKEQYKKGSNAYFSDSHTTPPHSKRDPKEQEVTEQKKTDLMLFSSKEQEIMKVMWEEGAVKNGDRLIPKNLVIKEFADNRLITRKCINDLYAKLEAKELIIFKGGYKALTELTHAISLDQ